MARTFFVGYVYHHGRSTLWRPLRISPIMPSRGPSTSTQKKKRSRPIPLLIILLTILIFLPEPETSKFQTATINAKKSSQTTSTSILRRNQTIVVLPGPHKTGTTSVQAALYKWIQIDHRFPDWVYPVPAEDEFEAIQSTYGTMMIGAKGFSPMITRLFADPTLSPQEIYQQSHLLQLYGRKVQEAWRNGNNIVIASEHLDRLAVEPSKGHHHSLSPQQLWDRFLQVLPPYANVEIGIHYRTPRIEHLLSMWHQLGKRQETLAHFITKPSKPGLQSTMHSLNALGLADFFVKQGYRVKILNTGNATMDLPSAVTCHILQIPSSCNSILTAPRLNHRPDPGERDVPDEILVAIDQLLWNYDCQLASRMDIAWIYGDSTFDKCTKSPTKVQPFSQTIQAIVDLICRSSPNTKYCGTKTAMGSIHPPG